jgi:uncharacterized protein YbjT (DUF2867 family)
MRSRLQPVAIEDVVHLLAGTLDGEPHNRKYDVGGDEVLSYPELLAVFAEVAGLRRLQVIVPWAPQELVGRIVALITRMPRTTVTALVESLRHDMVCTEDDARRELADEDHVFVRVAEAFARSLDSSGPEGTARTGDVQAPALTDPA